MSPARRPGRATRASASSPTVSSERAGGAPASRRSSAASVGPRNDTSANPRPSSSAMMAGSTPDARGLPDPVGPRGARANLMRRPRRRAWPCVRDRRAVRRPWGRSLSTIWAAESRSASCSGESRTSIRHRLRRRGQRPHPFVAEHAPQHLSGRQAWDVTDHDDVAELLVGRQRPRHELLQLAVGYRQIGVEQHRGDGHLAGSFVGYPEHGTVADRGMTVQAPPPTRPAPPGSRSP